MIKKYFSLAKPGIIAGNALAAFAGFALASHGRFFSLSLIATLLGLSCIIGGSCVLNNYIDRDIDAMMKRTQQRALVLKAVSVRGALIYAACMLGFGTFLLVLFTNLLAAGIAVAGAFLYVVVYSLWAKRSTEYATEIGSMAGAVPPVVGYCAVTGSLDGGAALLFMILCFWQMPHFFAIALRRKDEYAAASIPVLPLTKGVRTTKVRMILYIVLYCFAAIALFAYGFVGYVYLVTMSLVSCAWLFLALKGFVAMDTSRWARSTFLTSLVVLLVFVVSTSIDAL